MKTKQCSNPYGAPITDSPANKLTCAIINYLRYQGHSAVRVNTVGVRGRKISTKSKGVADVVCILKPSGRHLEVEIKIRPDKPSIAQLERQKEIQDKGGLYWFVSTLDEFLCLDRHRMPQHTNLITRKPLSVKENKQ